jgi:hypothetical protein
MKSSVAIENGPSRTRRQLPGLASYALVSAVVGLALFASLVPSPLYSTYARLWHFSPVTLTLVYATYAVGVLLALLLAGGPPTRSGGARSC